MKCQNKSLIPAWVYKGRIVENHDDLLPECTDIVYLITYTDGKRYIGKRAVRSMRRKPPLKGKKRNRIVLTNLPFQKYVGSHESETAEIISREILYQCSGRKTATYIEAAIMFSEDIIFDDGYINENILGRFFKRDLENLLDN